MGTRRNRKTLEAKDADERAKKERFGKLHQSTEGAIGGYANTTTQCPVKFSLGTGDDKFVNEAELNMFNLRHNTSVVPRAIEGFLQMVQATDPREIESIEFVVTFKTPEKDKE